MLNAFVVIIFFLAILAGVIALQIFLSKKQNRWLGLVLPLVCLVFSIIVVLGIPTYSTLTVKEQTLSESGEVVNNAVNSGMISSITTNAAIISIFLLHNIPTIVLLAIYYGYQEKMKMRKELEKMNIQDLE